MVKDYFQDILPPQGSSNSSAGKTPSSPTSIPINTSDSSEEEPAFVPPEPAARSIRNISVVSRPPRRPAFSDNRGGGMGGPDSRKKGGKKWLMMIVVAVVLALLLALLAFVAMRPTTVRVIPRTHTVVFDSSMQFRAFPGNSAATGTLPYIINTADLDDSAVVPAQGVETVEEKARGTITVVNNYSADPVKLIANTRFQTPDGLIFRTPIEVKIPGKSGSKAGELAVQVVADMAGEKYNVGPVTKFTLPGLKSTADMYANVYAKSTTAMVGGFSGQRPAVAPAAFESAKAAVRERLEQQIRTAAQNQTNPDFIVLPDLIRITYSSLPPTKENDTNVRIHERAHVEIPAFPTAIFAQTVAREVSADVDNGAITFENLDTLTARYVAASSTPALGSEAFNFTLEGTSKVVWKVDQTALAEALAGREESSFEAIVGGFSGIDEAYARIQPFWKNSFPADPEDIQIRLEELAQPTN